MCNESVAVVLHAAGAHTSPGQSGKGWELAAVHAKPSVLETDAGNTAEHPSSNQVLMAPCGPVLPGELSTEQNHDVLLE